MKKLGMVMLGVCVFAASGVMAQDAPLSLSAGWANAAPTIDGVVNLDEYATAARISINALDEIPPGVTTEDSTLVGGPNSDGKQSIEDSSALVYIMNDGDNFYLAFDITDDVLDVSLSDNFRNDGIEIRIDSDNNKSDDRETGVDFFPTILRDGKTGDFVAEFEEAATSEKADGTGFMAEYRVSAQTFADIIGFDVAINDSDDPAEQNRDTQYRWTGADDAAWNDPFKWGDLTLATGPGNGVFGRMVSGQATTTPTLDGTLEDGEWAGATMVAWDANDEIRPGVTTEDAGLVGGQFGNGKQTYEDSHAVAYLMNDEEWFYMAVDVTDDVLDFSRTDGDFRNDGIEVRIDPDFDKTDDREDGVDIFPTYIGDGSLDADGSTDTYNGVTVLKPDGSGFILEFRASMSVMAPVIGFDLAINDNDDGAEANRDTQYRIVGADDASWNDPFKWGELVLYSSGIDSDTWKNY